MPLRVGFDLDGTVADMHHALRREAVALFGEDVLRKAAATSSPPQAGSAPGHEPAESTTKSDEQDNPAMLELHLTARQQSQLWDHVKKIVNFWSTLPELEPGIISRIAKTASARRWEVIFLTTRPASASAM